ncbi:sterile alpha motif domain containing 11 [Plakobranchus ocellatus]|uniref:Sterile alpha motif domain containing 11 n=1 Tax=Plakobranchus ocellatus TaxID=259542 RepID=A0AAV3YBG6_9GAST|nr:sterile alpha motif domain containing 11 [Plakobranchus ocellatus]
MKKRSRRAKARGKKAPVTAAVDPTVVPLSQSLEDTTPLPSDEFEAGGDGRRKKTTATSSSYDAVNGAGIGGSATDSAPRTVPAVKITTSKTGSNITSSATAVGNSNSISTTTAAATVRSGSSSNSSSVDEAGPGSDAEGEADLSEPMHTGFMQNGPKNYRVGSTVVNLNNCSEEDVTPEFRHRDICLQVECGDNTGLMYMSKLYQGSKGKCIEVDGDWYTPNEFQAVSGRESAKDWKRSIRHQGRSLKLLLSRNVLDVHPAACRCDSCRELQLMTFWPPPDQGPRGGLLRPFSGENQIAAAGKISGKNHYSRRNLINSLKEL